MTAQLTMLTRFDMLRAVQSVRLQGQRGRFFVSRWSSLVAR